MVLAGLLPEWNLRPVVDALQAMRGIALINAVVLVTEVGDFARFSNPRQLMAYFGLVPGKRSSGETVRRGGITKTGNTHAGRALVEGACGPRRPRRTSEQPSTPQDSKAQIPSRRSSKPWRDTLKISTLKIGLGN